MNNDFIDIELDKPRKMALPLGSLRRAEREINRLRTADGLPPMPIFKVIDEQITAVRANGAVSAEIMLLLLWASLLHQEPELTITQVENMTSNAMYCSQKVFECVATWMQTPKLEQPGEVGDDAALPLDRLNGTISGQPAGSTSG